MRTFSERYGHRPVQSVLQVESMNDDLRNALWNAFQLAIWDSDRFLYSRSGTPGIDAFSKFLWARLFKKPIDSRPISHGSIDSTRTLLHIRQHFFNGEWHEVYSFAEVVVTYFARTHPKLPEYLNSILTAEMAGYRFIDNQIAPITSSQEVEALELALSDKQFGGVEQHLARALQLLSDRTNPDYRNSLKESTSAVEALARHVSGNPQAKLGDALKTLEKSGKLHPSLSGGFSKLYGYTSDASGIRHSMMEESNLTQADAKYFLLSCTSFVNYLKGSLSQHE